jgi:YfiH family protein
LNPDRTTRHGNDPHWHWIDWPVPGVRAGYSLRDGGVSAGPYASFNLGDHVGDDPLRVQANRSLLRMTLGVRPVYLRQVHGWHVQLLPSPDGTEADSAYAVMPDVACCIMVADCLPILISDERARVVAAAHAGWRGLCGDRGVGVVESLMRKLKRLHPDATWVAWLGPCIGPQAFEVGEDVRSAYAQFDASSGRHFQPLAERPGKWWCDLPALARDRLVAQGVQRIWGNDGSADWCTHSRPDLYFSHRRDKVSGRQAAAIFLDRS